MISIKQNYSLGSMDPGLLLFIKNNLLFYCVSKPISRVMSWVIIYLGHPLPNGSSGPPESTTGSRIAFFSALLQMEFTCARPVTRPAVVSYTAFPPLPAKPAVYFCCTGLGVASTGRYPASCPVKPGLSSSEPFRLSSRDYLVCLRKCYSSMVFSVCKAQNHLHIKTAAANKLPEYGIVGNFFTGHCHKIVQELQQTVGFQVLRLPFLNAK